MEPINSRWWRSSSGSTEEPPPIKRCGDEDGGFERLQVFGLTVWWIHPGDSSSAEQPHSVLSAFFKRWQILDILCKKPQSSLQHWHFSVCFRWCFSPLWFCFPAGTFAQVSVTSSVWMFTGHTDAYRLKTILCSAEACTTHPGCLYVIWLH